MRTSLKKTLIAAAFATSAVGVSAQAATDPVITYTFPDHVNLGGGAKHKRVSGALLNKVYDGNGKIKKLRLTCEFAEALDPNNQKFCRKDSKLPGVYKAMRHYAVSHKTCRKQFGQVETAARKRAGDTNVEAEVNQLAGAGWQNSSYCPLIDARNQVMDAYRRMGMTAE